MLAAGSTEAAHQRRAAAKARARELVARKRLRVQSSSARADSSGGQLSHVQSTTGEAQELWESNHQNEQRLHEVYESKLQTTMRMVAEREQAVYESTGVHLRGMAETSVEKAENELNAEALKWKRNECEIFEAEKGLRRTK